MKSFVIVSSEDTKLTILLFLRNRLGRQSTPIDHNFCTTTNNIPYVKTTLLHKKINTVVKLY